MSRFFMMQSLIMEHVNTYSLQVSTMRTTHRRSAIHILALVLFAINIEFGGDKIPPV